MQGGLGLCNRSKSENDKGLCHLKLHVRDGSEVNRNIGEEGSEEKQVGVAVQKKKRLWGVSGLIERFLLKSFCWPKEHFHFHSCWLHQETIFINYEMQITY